MVIRYVSNSTFYLGAVLAVAFLLDTVCRTGLMHTAGWWTVTGLYLFGRGGELALHAVHGWKKGVSRVVT